MAAPTISPPPPPLSEKARGKQPAHAPIPLNGVSSKSAATRSVRFSTQNQAAAPLTDVHRRARLRLLPLLAIEADLTRKLFPELAAGLNPLLDVANAGDTPGPATPAVKEVCVRAGNGWKSVLASLQAQGEKSKGKGNANGNAGATDELTTVLAACREDVLSLWEDQAVRAVLKRRGIRLQDMPGL